jgi:hypothetical protein
LPSARAIFSVSFASSGGNEIVILTALLMAPSMRYELILPVSVLDGIAIKKRSMLEQSSLCCAHVWLAMADYIKYDINDTA